MITGGGCMVYAPSDQLSTDLYAKEHPLVSNGPIAKPPNGSGTDFARDIDDIYQCAYDNRVNHQDIIVVATAICFDVQP